jgi:DNA-binding MarR family transcriptional regulator
MSDRSSCRLSNLEAHLGYWLRHVSNHVSGDFARALQARQFSVAEWVALRQLYDHPNVSSGALAELLGVTRGAISKILDKLEDKGLVARVTRAEDKRSQALSLTQEGLRLLPELAELADENDAHHFDCLDPHEQAQLRKLLQKLAQVRQWNDVPLD